MEHNPYSPPSSSDEPEPDGLVFSPEGVRVVSSLASWMRGLSIFYFVGIGLMALGSCGALSMGAGAMVLVVAMLVAVVLIGLAATWLRSAAEGFERGVLSDDEFPIGQGFRSLRAYLIMFGIFGIFTLVNQIRQVAGVL